MNIDPSLFLTSEYDCRPLDLMDYANKGYVEAAIKLGNLIYNGLKNGGKYEFLEEATMSDAIYWWKKSLSSNLILTDEQPSSEDYAELTSLESYYNWIESLKKSAMSGNIHDRYVYGKELFTKISPPEDYFNVTILFKSVAGCSDVSKTDLSYLGCRGCNDEWIDGHTKDEAIYWYREATKKMEPYYKYELGQKYLYLNNKFEMDPHEAKRWFKLAADEGCPEAMNDYVVLKNTDMSPEYDMDGTILKIENNILRMGGASCPTDKKDIGMLKDAANKCSLEPEVCDSSLSGGHYEMTGVLTDGSLTAMYNLGNVYFYAYCDYDCEDLKCDYSYNDSFKWYKMAAERRHPLAQEKLCLSYICGLGVEQSFEMAERWLNIIRENGSTLLDEIAPFKEYLDNKKD